MATWTFIADIGNGDFAGDVRTANNDLTYRIYNNGALYHKTGSHTSDSNVTLVGSIVTITNVPLTASTNYLFTIASVDEAGNQNILSNIKNVTSSSGAPIYILDTYTGAKAAYSLRKLKTGALYACKVRRVSDNATCDVVLETSGTITINSTIANLSAGSGSTLAAWIGSGSGHIQTWYDQSGTLNHITQSTSSNQPRLVASGVLETKGVLFDGVNDSLSITSNPSLQITGDMSAYVVFNITSFPTTNANIFIKRNSDSDREYEFRVRNIETRYLDDNNSQAYVNTNSTGVNYLQSFDRSANTSVIIYKNGTNSGSKSLTGTNTTSTAPFQVGARAVSSSNWLSGGIKELIIWDSNKSSDRTGITNNINTEYTIY